MMVELFCGILGGTPAGKDCRQWRESDKAANLAQCFVAVDPECFAPEFPQRLQSFLDQNRELKPVDEEKPVLVAGDPERQNEERCRKAGGLIYGQRQIDKLANFIFLLKIDPLFTEVNCRATQNSIVQHANFIKIDIIYTFSFKNKARLFCKSSKSHTICS